MEPERHEKGWGYELWIVNNNLYCGKILHFNKGKKCSWHYHKVKQETFYVQKGKLKIYNIELSNIRWFELTHHYFIRTRYFMHKSTYATVS